MKFDCVGFGSINIDEIWETSSEFFDLIGVKPGEETAQNVEWFNKYYPLLKQFGVLRAVSPGGSAANTIAALCRMGFSTGFFGAVGLDVDGKIDLAEIGLSSHLRIKRTQLPSGRCLALINTKDRQRDRSLVIVPNANDLVNTDASDLGYFCNANWVHFTSFVSNGPLEAQGKVLQNLPDDVNVSFDPGAVYCGLGIKHLEHMVARCQVLFLTKEELFTLMGLGSIEKAVSRLISIGAKTIILKLGAKGIMAFQANNTSFQEAVPPTYVVDRTGAGDVAAAGLLAGLILGLPLIDCLGLAVRAASRSIEGYGRLKYPDRKFLKDFLTELNGKFFS